MRLPKFEQWEAVRIEWQDASRSGQSWGKLNKHDVQVDGVVTVGMVHSQDQVALVIIQSRDPLSKDVLYSITIPVRGITGFKRLK